MQKMLEIQGKEYKVKDLEGAIECILVHMEDTKKSIKKYEEINYESEIKWQKGILSGLESALFYLTGERS